MKFQAKLSGLLTGLQPAVTTSQVGVKRDYDDGGRVSLTASGSDLFAEANNGNVAVRNVVSAVVGADFKPEVDGSVTVKSVDLVAMLSGFASEETVTIEVVGNELIVTLNSDDEQKSSQPCESRAVVMPVAAATFEKEVEIKRPTLTNAMKKIFVAVGEEKHRPQFCYWVLRVRHDGFRAAAGDGSRFSVYEIEGANVVKSKNEFNIHISREHNAVFQKVLENGSNDAVLIREFGSDPNTAQIVVTFDNITMTLIGHDPGIKWPDENKFLKRVSPIKYTTALSDWSLILKSITATYNDDVRQQNQVHHCVMNFDTKKSVVLVKADNFMKTTRKVKIIDSEFAPGSEVSSLPFTCLSQYMVDVQKYGDPTDRIQMEFVDTNVPVVIRFFAGDKVAPGPLVKDNPTQQTKEQYVMFIAATASPKRDTTAKAS